jgi:hypothetical protein
LIDGAYLLSHEDKKLNKYQRVDANCEAMKRELAARCKIPVVASFQFNRVAAKKISKNEEKKTDVELQVGLEDIAHSDAIGQISSIVLGFFEEQTPENINVKRVDILKGRGGEQGVFKCRWDFQHMDFSEILEGDSPEEGTFNDEQPDMEYTE